MKPKFYGNYKAIKAGARGLVVHLPMAFSRLNNIKPGTEVSLYMVEDDTSFLLVQAPKKEKKS